MLHLRPFHRSASIRWPVWPTAMHDERDGQATAIKKLCREPAGLGVGWIVHLRPSHRSASVTSLPEAPTASPTAVHADGALHATPMSVLMRAPAGFGVRWTLQLRPFHRSAKVTDTFEAFLYVPTAVHDDGPVQVPNSS